MTPMTPHPAVRAAADLQGRPSGAMLLSTTDEVPGYRVARVLGLVRGNTVRVRHVGHDILAGFRNLVGGEVTQYTQMLAQSREQALDRMRGEALALHANGIVAIRFTTAAVMQGAAEILVYGTAVLLERITDERSP